MNLLLLVALAVPLICLALLSSLGFLGVMTLGLVLHVAGTFMARIRWLISALPPKCMDPPCVARENGEPGVRSCTNVSGLALELVLRNPRASDLVSGHASKGYFGGQFSDAPGRPILHLFSFSRRPRWGNDCGSHAVSGDHRHCAAGFIDLTSKLRPP